MSEAIPVVAKVIDFIWAGLVTAWSVVLFYAINAIYEEVEEISERLDAVDDWRSKHGGGV